MASEFLGLKPTSLGKWDHRISFLTLSVSVTLRGKSFHKKLAIYIINLFPCILYPGPYILLIIILHKFAMQFAGLGS